MRVHTDSHADDVARAHLGDAVSIGSDVYFRQGNYRPRDNAGFGLLVHEATHVATALQPGAQWRRLTGRGGADEESHALTRERAALADRAPAPLNVPQHISAPAPDVARPQPAQPMAAAADRAAQERPEPLDVDALRRHLLDDLKRQLRSEFERGG